jgi:hypothetical protein
MRPSIPALLILSVVIACADGDDTPSATEGDWVTERSISGDTTIVRTIAGNLDSITHTLTLEWRTHESDAEQMNIGSISQMAVGRDGRVFMYDSQRSSLQMIDSAGKFLRSIGRRGEGPGEYRNVRGLTTLPDGRVALWDSQLSRITLFDPDSDARHMWQVTRRTFSTTEPSLLSDTAGFLYLIHPVTPRPEGQRTGRPGLIRFDSHGTTIDSLLPPDSDLVVQQVNATSFGVNVAYDVPYAPRVVWTWSPLGYLVAGRSDRYAIDLIHPDGRVVRIERDGDPPPVEKEVRESATARLTAEIVHVSPSWRWNGPPVPEIKPFFNTISVTQEGRIWVHVNQPSQRVVFDSPPQPPGTPPRTGWSAPIAHDFFEADGTFLGRLRAPQGATMRVIRGNHVWGILRDEDGVQSVARWRITPGFRGQ